MEINRKELDRFTKQIFDRIPVVAKPSDQERTIGAALMQAVRIADAIERYVDEKIDSDKVLLRVLKEMNPHKIDAVTDRIAAPEQNKVDKFRFNS